MMDCTQLRERLDAYVDRELSPDALAAADAHLSECHGCRRVVTQLQSLRRQVRQVVTAQLPPPELAGKVAASLAPWPLRVLPAPRLLALAATALLAIGLGGWWVARSPEAGLTAAVAGAVDDAVVGLASPVTMNIEGTLVCRDCELNHEYGQRIMCNKLGHRGAIETSDGRIWNIVEEPGSSALIHDGALLGRSVRVRAKVFRHAGAVAIETYTIL